MTLTRRSFLRVTAIAGGGMLVCFRLPACAPRGRSVDSAGARLDTEAGGVGGTLTAYFRIDPDGGVTVMAHKVEMGQGTWTSLPMILADELDADWSRVTVAPAPYDDRRYGWQGVGGSTSLWEGWVPLRQAGAAAREMLRAAAAQRFGVPASELRTEAGRVVHEASGRSAHYGELAADAASLPVPEDPPLKDASSFRIIGQPMRQVGLDQIVTGRMRYAYDTRVADMLRVSVERAPTPGARPVRVDDARARAVSGVHDVVPLDRSVHSSILGHGVAVLATSTWAALKGRRALDIEWSADGREESSDALSRRFRERIDRPGKVLRDDGDAVTALRSSARTVRADYELPFLAHAPMEPGNCFAHVQPDGVTLRGPLQDPQEAAAFAAEIAGVPLERVRVEPARLGGGFGRRLSSDYAAEAVALALRANAPVHVVWTREDDIRFDFYRPAALHRIEAGLDAEGRVVAWLHRQVSTSRYGYQAPSRPPEDSEFYTDDPPAGMVPNYRVEYTPVESLIPRGPWRSVIHSGNGFAVRSFIDELAHAAGRDPVQFRLAMLGEDRELPYGQHGGPAISTARLRRVLEVAAEGAGWGSPPPQGRARGVAVHFTFGGYAAQVAEVSVDDAGRITVHRVVASIDSGLPVNPLGIRGQVEGGIVYGLTSALYGEITLRDGGVVQGNFNDYPLLASDAMPEIDVHIIPSTEAPKGTGEMSVPPIAPAVANAVFAATGVRVRKLPLTPDALRAAAE